MKVAKEEIVGLLTALKMFVEENEEEEMRRYARMVRQVEDALAEVPGLEVTVHHDDYDYLIPHAVLRFEKDWQGPSRNQVLAALEGGDPPIYFNQQGNPDEFAVDPLNLTDDNLETVTRRLREELLR
jgi:L-seryl-tRNA(Ser) seleniumtransferase